MEESFSIFHETCLTVQEKIDVMQRFTRAYRQNSGVSPALREARCLREQFPAVMGRMREEDLFAGRLGALAVGFNPQAECMQLGYYLDEEEMRRMLRGPLSGEQRAVLVEIRDFWRRNHTVYKIKQSYPEDLWEALPDKNYVYGRAPAYAIYRISGTHLDFEKLLTLGADGLRGLLARKSRETGSAAARDLYEAMGIALDIYTDTCRYYQRMAAAMREEADGARRGHLAALEDTLGWVACRPARGLMDAIQAVLIYWLLSGSFNFGRMDTYLAGYYARDVDSGALTEDGALRLLVGMWRAMSLRHKPYDTRVFVGGEGRARPEEADRFSKLAIRATMATMDVTPQLSLRFSRNTPGDVLDLAYEAIGKGATFPILYCDEVNIPAVQQAFGVPYEEAAQYCPYGCGEYVLFHRGLGTPSGLINLLKVLETTLNHGYDLHTGEPQAPDLGGLADYASFEELWDAYARQVSYFTDALAVQEELEYRIAGEECAFLFFSILFDDCIERGEALLSGGARYLGGTLESYGNINAADSLTAIRKVVYEERSVTPSELMRALRTNFEGDGGLRRKLLDAPKFGNDQPAADEMACRVHEQVCRAAIASGKKTGLDSYLVVIINNNANTVLGKHTAASADGRPAHTFMANANNPYRGADKKGLTAMLNSLLKLDPRIHAGCVQNVKFSKQMFADHLAVTRSIMDAYFQSGGSQAMLSVVGREDLQNALREPQKYRNLLVRVGGFSARFVELAPLEQQEILERTLY